MKLQAEILVEQRPDLIILTTPHGLRLKDTFVIQGNSMVDLIIPRVFLPPFCELFQFVL